MSTNDILARLGLQRRFDPSDHLLTIVGLFAAGAMVGSGLALLFSPQPGRALRDQIRTRIRQRFSRTQADTGSNGIDLPDDPDAMTRAELYELAKQLEIVGRSDMSKQQLFEALSRYRS